MPSEQTPQYADRLRLDGRVFVVLGAGQGIGRESCHALAQSGAMVACVDRDPGLADKVAGEVAGIALSGDITVRADVVDIFEKAAAAGPVRGLVDIVGMNVAGPIMETDDDAWSKQLSIVLDHAFLAAQIGGRAIQEAGGGSMTFVGSISGAVTTGLKHGIYGIAKAGLHKLAAYAATEMAPSVRANVVAPGITLTPRSAAKFTDEQLEKIGDLVPAGRPAEVPEIASAILFLASDLASYITGQTLVVDGGLAETVRLDRIF